ncbi:MAG: hydantoinase B/oxoprolinase family protein [Pseudomonadota bacterium]|nr:hydantoinase B/oxoprolinase family protein [Pseudomonadota bacterium]
MDPIELTLFASRVSAVCEEMGAQLQRAAFSPNVRDRLDYSCAVFGETGELCAQAAHIPVHLGSMAFAMRGIVESVSWAPGDMVMLNDPFLGGTHLPDVTVIAPFYAEGHLGGFVANRAHHADIGADTPGSMPVSRSLFEEGQVIPPTHVMRDGRVDDTLIESITGATRNPRDARGDFAAQIGANHRGLRRLAALVDGTGLSRYRQSLSALNAYGERMATIALDRIPRGVYTFADFLDDDGVGCTDIAIRVNIEVGDGKASVDFDGTSPQVEGNLNCPLSVTAAGVYYVFRCLMPPATPACAGTFRPIGLSAPEGCLLNARHPAAVAAGNVETSTRIVDTVLGALAGALPEAVPAASHGSMNNVAAGSSDKPSWGYYETIGGGMGAGPSGGGLSGVQTHMTNTRNTPVEVLEGRYPLRVGRYEIRKGSGGDGKRAGGDGLVRELEFLDATQFTLLTERRIRAPWGLAGGRDARPGSNYLNGRSLPAKYSGRANAGDVLRIETPGGGGWGVAAGGSSVTLPGTR